MGRRTLNFPKTKAAEAGDKGQKTPPAKKIFGRRKMLGGLLAVLGASACHRVGPVWEDGCNCDGGECTSDSGSECAEEKLSASTLIKENELSSSIDSENFRQKLFADCEGTKQEYLEDGHPLETGEGWTIEYRFELEGEEFGLPEDMENDRVPLEFDGELLGLLKIDIVLGEIWAGHEVLSGWAEKGEEHVIAGGPLEGYIIQFGGISSASENVGNLNILNSQHQIVCGGEMKVGDIVTVHSLEGELYFKLNALYPETEDMAETAVITAHNSIIKIKNGSTLEESGINVELEWGNSGGGKTLDAIYAWTPKCD